MRLKRILEGLEGVETVGVFDGEQEIENVQTDSRKCGKNGVFVCLLGKNTDGHLKVQEAIKNGAVAIVTERKLNCAALQIIVPSTRRALGIIAANFYGNPANKMKLIGITGTNGKTTTSYMVASILKRAGKEAGIIGTLGIVYKHKKLPSDLTTPDPLFLHEILADMYVHGVEYVVMEVSAHALYYHKTEGVAFRACIFTNLTQDHLDFFPSMDEYGEAKSRLFAPNVCEVAIVNGDDKKGRSTILSRENAGARTVFYGLDTPADCFAVVTEESLRNTECLLNISDKLCRVRLSMVGRHNVYNALAAAACAVELGIEVTAIEEGLSLLKSVCGRLEKVAEVSGAYVYVDFAHTPDGLEKSLDALRRYCKGRLLCLFGCGGNRDKGKRPLMGEIVAKKSDFAVLTSDNPRYEDPLDIISDIEKGYRRFSARYVVVPDRRKAIDYALEFLKKGDVLLVAGKGGEEHQEIMGIKYAFDDHTVIETLLMQKGKNI